MKNTKSILILFISSLLITLSASADGKFTNAEQQIVSIETPGLFERSNAFSVDFSILGESEYSFPLPVGKAEPPNGGGELRINTEKGDAVKSMFDGTVRLSRKTSQGNTIVVRHPNGLETVYANNAQNLVSVGQKVKAGQTLAIVGSRDGECYCLFSIMVNGRRINPETLIEVGTHRLRRQTVMFKKEGNRVTIATRRQKKEAETEKTASKERNVINSLDPDDELSIINTTNFKIDLEKIENEHWAYPLPGSHVISPYGGRRNHAGVDIKTKPNDEIVAAFDGEVTRSGPYYGYGNCIVIKHAYGFETLYSHQSKNFVKKGQKVKAGEVIGLTGRTGRATTEHLHFEVHFKGRRIDPAIIFNHANKQLQAATISVSNGRLKSVKH